MGKNIFSIFTFPASLHSFEKKIEILDLVKSVSFQSIDSLESNVTEFELTFEVSCEQICNSKDFSLILPWKEDIAD